MTDDSEDDMPVGSPCYAITVYMQMALYEVTKILPHSRVTDPYTDIVLLILG